MAVRGTLPKLPGSSSSSGGTSFSSSGFHLRKPRQSQFTTQQLIKLAFAKGQQSKKHDTFIGSVLHGGAHGLGSVLDFIGRPYHAYAEGNKQAYLSSHNKHDTFGLKFLGGFGKGYAKGLAGRSHATYSDVLKTEGLFKGHSKSRAAVGLTFDIGADPLTYLTGGSSLGVKSGVKAANEAIMHPQSLADLEHGAEFLADKPMQTHAARKALNRLDTRVYLQARDIAAKDAKLKNNFSTLDSKDFYKHLPFAQRAELEALRGSIKSQALHESRKYDIWHPEVKFANKRIAQLPWKSPSLYGSSSTIVKAFRSDVRDELYGLHIHEKHFAEDSYRNLTAMKMANGDAKKALKILNKHNTENTIKALTEIWGVPEKIFDQKLYTKLNKELSSISRLKMQGIPWQHARAKQYVISNEPYIVEKLLGANATEEQMGKLARRIHAAGDKGTLRDLAMIDNPAAAGLVMVKGWKGTRVPEEINNALKRYHTALTTDEVSKEMMHTLKKLNTIWKVSVTSLVPGYGIRNTMTDIWNAYLLGMPLSRMPVYTKRAISEFRTWGKALKKAEAGTSLSASEKKILRDFQEMSDNGILSGLFAGDIQEGGTVLSKPYSAYKYNPVKFYAKGAQDLNRNRENIGRIAHYLWRRKALGEHPTEAARQVKIAHFDYTDLTPFERDKLRLLIPFYTWFRKNLPYQLQSLYRAPGRVDNFFKVAGTSEEMAGGTKGELTPDFIQKSMTAFKVPFLGKHTYYNPSLGISDLEVINHPKDLFSRFSPAITVPYEIHSGKNFATGRDTTGKQPINSKLGSILKHIPGTGVTTITKNVGGKQVKATAANSWLGTAFGAEPWFRFAASQNPIDTGRRGVKVGPLGGYGVSFLSGQPFFNYDQKSLLRGMSSDAQHKADRYIRELKLEGFIPPSKKRKVTRYQRTFDKNVGTAFGRSN